MKANETQVGGTHYAGAYQHWDLVADLRLGYFEGQISKYVSRWRKKNGLQDLEKACHFLSKLIELAADGWVCTSGSIGWYDKHNTGLSVFDLLNRYCESNGIAGIEREVVCGVCTWRTRKHLIAALALLSSFMEEQRTAENPGPGYVNQDR